MTLSRFAFELTTRCNLNCKHCLREKREKSTDLSLEVLDKVLRQGREGYGIQVAAFTGGEPLMHPQLEKVLELVVENDYYFSLVTNGHLIPKRLKLFTRPEIKKRLTNICLSLDGHEEAIHDRIRGPGAYRKAMAAMILIRNAGIPLTIKYTIGRHNHDSIEEAMISISHLKVDRVELAHTYPTPDNLGEGLVLDPAECRAVESIIYRLATELKMSLTMTAGVFSPQKFYSCTSLNMADMYVDAEGRLCLCCMLPGIRGRNAARKEPDVVADLSKVDLWDAHRKLLSMISGLHRARLDRIAKGDLEETDHFQCIACARYMGKLDWLEDYEGNPWNPAGRKKAAKK